MKNVGLIFFSTILSITSISSCDDSSPPNDASLVEVTGDTLIDFLLSTDVKFKTTYSLKETQVVFQKEGNTCSGDPAGSVEIIEELWSLNPGSKTIVINDDTDVDFVGNVADFRSFSDITNGVMVITRANSEPDENFVGITNSFQETLTVRTSWKQLSNDGRVATFGLESATGSLVTITKSTSTEGLECEIRQVWDVIAIPQESITRSIKAASNPGGVRG